MRFKKHITESSLSRIMTHIEKTPQFGVISPFRKENSDEENERYYNELIDKVRKMGYGYILMRGGYTGDEGFFGEKSLFIPNIKRSEILKLGKEYNQHSVIHKDKDNFALVGTNKQAGVGKVLDKFAIKKRGLSVDDVGDKFQDFFSGLVRASTNQRGKKFLFQMQERVETSMYHQMKHGETWINLLGE